ncbi:MAG TPA: hypothetical protein VFP23_00985 [Solirubrobacterales bacterium]|nr:hypothetical protein [Solirubrobacterales bacterium]
MRARWVRWRPIAAAVGLALVLVTLAHPLAAASDVWANVGPAQGIAGLAGRYPLGNYALDEHFTAISAGVFSGVDVSGVPPMIAYFLADVLWQLTAFLANALISLFSFAFSLDLVNGSEATGGAGALGPVAAAIHSIYANVFGQPWLVVAVAVAGLWAMWKGLVQRRYSETAGSLGLSLIYVVLALFFVAQPAQTIGSASAWTNAMSGAFLGIAQHGSPSGTQQAKQAGADQLFSLLVFEPWTVLEFGGTEHCVRAGTGSGGTEPVSVPVRPLARSAVREVELERRLAAGEEVSSEGKVCIDNAKKYAAHFLRFGPGSSERNAEYTALHEGDSSKLPEADPERHGYRLGPPDKPAADAMGEGGQYQRLLVALVVFVGELGAFCLLGALSVGVILAQILLLLLLAFAPVALVAAVIPGRGHDFFKGWLSKLASYLLRKAAYSLILAILLAVCAAIAAATSALGWFMSFGLQALFLWAVFLQRRTLTESLIGIATGPNAPGREGALRVLALYYGARTVNRPLRGLRRSARRAVGGTVGRLSGGKGGPPPSSSSGPGPETDPDRPGGGGAQGASAPRAARTQRRASSAANAAERAPASKRSEAPPAPRPRKGRGGSRPTPPQAGRVEGAGSAAQPAAPRQHPTPGRPEAPRRPAAPAPQPEQAGQGESPLAAELRAERERLSDSAAKARDAARKPERPAAERRKPGPPVSPPARRRRRFGKRGGRR